MVIVLRDEHEAVLAVVTNDGVCRGGRLVTHVVVMEELLLAVRLGLAVHWLMALRRCVLRVELDLVLRLVWRRFLLVIKLAVLGGGD